MLLSFSFEMQSMPPFLVSVVHNRHVSMKLNILVSLFEVGSHSSFRWDGNFFLLSFHFCPAEFRHVDEWLNNHTESNPTVSGYIEMVESHRDGQIKLLVSVFNTQFRLIL